MLGVGEKAPDFTLPDQNGEEVTLSDLQGGTVVIYFYPRADTRVDKSGTAQTCPQRSGVGFWAGLWSGLATR